MGCDVVSAAIALTHACKAVMGQRLVFCVWGLRPKFNSSASTSSFYAAGNVRQRQRQRQPQQSVPLEVAAIMLACRAASRVGARSEAACSVAFSVGLRTRLAAPLILLSSRRAR